MTVERTEELEQSILNQIAEGASLVKVCSQKGMPSRWTVRKWVDEDPEFSTKYARAREDQADHYADEIVSIADNAEDTQKARLQVDARKWVASKLKSHAYGEKVTQVHSGPDGGPIQTEELGATERVSSRIAGIAARSAAPSDTE